MPTPPNLTPTTFAHLAQQRTPSLLLLVRRMLHASKRRGDCAADDLVQESLLRAWRLYQEGRAPGLTLDRMPAWLAQITRNTVRDRIDYLRRCGRAEARHLESLDGHDEMLLALLTSVTECASRNEALESAYEALAALPESQQQVVEAHLLAGQSIAQIAKRLGLSKNAVWERLQRGLRSMRARVSTTHLDDAASDSLSTS